MSLGLYFILVLFLSFAGDSKNQVHMEGYQVSNQCMALVRDGCLVPTKDAPELGSIRESSDKQYVPDVYYKVSTRCDVCCIVCQHRTIFLTVLEL